MLIGACDTEERPPPSGYDAVGVGPSTGANIGPADGGSGGVGGAGGGQGGDGGAGGQIPGSDCDLSGDCSVCIQCSRLADCVSLDIQCNNDPTCVDALACYSTCNLNCNGDAACYADCATTCNQQNVGFPAAIALIQCTCEQDCAVDCALDQPFDCIEQLF
jgi:hypothetical protein